MNDTIALTLIGRNTFKECLVFTVCIEIATNFIILNRHEEVFNVMNAVGENCNKKYKILAAECAADLIAYKTMNKRIW
ncbi:MAG: hypothetical protein LBC20_16965 [Planctomycetaceae bacterium]|jgi:hypothetical protein|nr:hypothetical protein [Planctomycetaceae bacterium]